MTPKQHADAINKAKTPSELNDALQNARNDGFAVKGSRTDVDATVQVGHTNSNGEFVPEHGQAVRVEPTDLGGGHVEKTTDVIYEDGQVVSVSDRPPVELRKNQETGELTPIEGPQPEPPPEAPAPKEAPRTEKSPPADVDKPKELPAEPEDAPTEPKEEPKDEDPSETGKETDCDGTCQTWEFGIGVLEGLIPTTLEGAALMALGFGLAIVAPGAAVALGVVMLGIGGFQLWNQWGTLSTAGRARGVGQMVGSVLPIVAGYGIRKVKGVGKGKGPPKANPPETPPADGPGTPDAPPKTPDTPDGTPQEKPNERPQTKDRDEPSPRPKPGEISPELEAKILYGEQKPFNPNKPSQTREIRGGHSPNIKNLPEYQVEIVRTNPDGTTVVKFRKELPDGTLSKPRPSTLAPDNWPDSKIINATKQVANTDPVATRISDRSTLHRQTIDGVMWEVVRDSNGNITGSYPTGGKPSRDF